MLICARCCVEGGCTLTFSSSLPLLSFPPISLHLRPHLSLYFPFFFSHILLSSPPITTFFYYFLSLLISLPPCCFHFSLSIMSKICHSHQFIFHSLVLFSLIISLSLFFCLLASVFSFSLLVYLGVGLFWPFLFHWHHPRNQEAFNGVTTQHCFVCVMFVFSFLACIDTLELVLQF